MGKKAGRLRGFIDGGTVAGNRVDRERADEARTILHPQSTL